jgi:hypothetical protein
MKKKYEIRHLFLGALVFFIFIGIVGSIGGKSEIPSQTSQVPAVQPPVVQKTGVVQTPSPSSVNTISKVDAQKELDEVIRLAKAANLVTSYEFSDRASVVYAGPAWYTQSVAFKKDFMAKISTLKKSITGFNNFEVRDANSNEKVGEVTAFSKSLEVYK